MDVYVIDFETFYSKDYSLSKISTEEYIRHPDFEVIGFAYKKNDEEPVWFSGDKKSTKAVLLSLGLDNSAVCAHNAQFDCAILAFIFGIIPARILDTLSMANAIFGVNEGVSLANLAKLHGIGEKGTEVIKAEGKRRVDFTPEELAAYGEYCVNDVVLDYILLHNMLNGYNLKPGGYSTGRPFPVSELRAIDMTIRMFIEPVLRLDSKVLQDNLWDVQENKRNLMYRLMKETGTKSEESLKSELMSNEKFAKLLETHGVVPPRKTSPTTGKETWAFAKTDPELLELGDHEDPTIQALVAARLGFKSTIEETRSIKFLDAAKRGVLPISLSYSGAHVTHRFSGSGGVNIQNLGRGSKLRYAIKAPKGKLLVIGDLSNIELRMGLWLSGQEDQLDKIRAGIDLYSDFGSAVFNRTYEDIRAEHKAGFSQDRFCSKEATLAGIFGTGGAKLQKTLALKGKLKLELEVTKQIINAYRATNYKVVEAWDEAKQVLNAMLHGMEMEYLRDGIIKVTTKGLVKPNGLILRYPNLGYTIKDGKSELTFEAKRRVREKVYPSKLFQRCVQSLSRDLMVHMMLFLNKKYRVVCTVHDECWICVDENEAEEAKAYMEKVLTTAPEWCASLPLGSEVHIGDSYGACK